MAETELKDFERQYVFAEYETGNAVSQIAAEMVKTEAFVYAQLRTKPEKYEDIKRIREERYNLTLRRVRGLADQITLEYLERLQNQLNNPDAGDEEKDTVFEQIEQVAKIGKQYAERVNLAEGKATENIGIGNNGKIPFEIIIRKAYEEEDEIENEIPQNAAENE